jgi:HEPN domain-containing protein
MSDREHARALLRMAKRDLDAITGMISLAPESSELFFSDEIFGFHAQQAAEKCLKAWVAGLGLRYPRSHDLMVLIELLAEAGEDTVDLETLVDLNPFAVEFRYEVMDPDEDKLDRSGILVKVTTVFDHV